MITAKTQKKLEAAFEASETMFAEFMDATVCIRDQVPIYKDAIAKVRAAKRAMYKEIGE